MKLVSYSRWYCWLCWHSEGICSCLRSLSWASSSLNHVHLSAFSFFGVFQKLIVTFSGTFRQLSCSYASDCIRIYMHQYRFETLKVTCIWSLCYPRSCNISESEFHVPHQSCLLARSEEWCSIDRKRRNISHRVCDPRFVCILIQSNSNVQLQPWCLPADEAFGKLWGCGRGIKMREGLT